MTAASLDKAILEIVQSMRIANQANFLENLEEKGFNLNQSTLSRHLRKLRIQKQDGYYQIAATPSERTVNAVRQLVTEVKLAPPNLVFIQALPGHAAAVGYYLDQLEIEQIVGTVAGDDTLLVAISPPEALQHVLGLIQRGLGLQKT